MDLGSDFFGYDTKKHRQQKQKNNEIIKSKSTQMKPH